MWQRDGLGRKITLISCAGLKKNPCTFQKSARTEFISRKLLLLPADCPSAVQAGLATEGAAPQLTLAGELVLTGGWSYSSEERHFDGIYVVTII